MEIVFYIEIVKFISKHLNRTFSTLLEKFSHALSGKTQLKSLISENFLN